ncbi:probable cyanate hydratase [Ceraceosorus bombacis]|uniref:Cyanate hydratase n=1 Tax=Ceraceosorus bombacis TaxID=401625 RepID=A0A0P1BB88_9BASI|nr:probable cyanate hydratase [Ceraceosorus bombacis]
MSAPQATGHHRPTVLANQPPVISVLHDAKNKAGLSFEQIAKGIDRSEWWTAGLFYGQAKPEKDDLEKLAKVLSIDQQYLVDALGPSFYPTRGVGDPVVYRLYEALLVYGHPIKALIHEKFGDGIMSAIDFTGSVEKEPNPKGDRVKITLNGKFLPYTKW